MWSRTFLKSSLEWNTDIAYRRKDAVERELLFNSTRDCWDLTRAGRERIEFIISACRAKTFDVRECYLWTKRLKKALDPDYVPSDNDAVRPRPLTAEEIAR